jgi:murein DD-endopeptidase MepM/ murein hydrolase activator NlpD
VCQLEANVPLSGRPFRARPPFQHRYTRTSPFGRRYLPIYKEWRLHTGQDLAAIPGGGVVVAAAAGTVASARREPDYGNIVTLRHRGAVTTSYAHLASIDSSIRPGAPVIIGQKLGMEPRPGPALGSTFTSRSK